MIHCGVQVDDKQLPKKGEKNLKQYIGVGKPTFQIIWIYQPHPTDARSFVANESL